MPDFLPRHLLWRMFMLACKVVVLSLQAFEVRAGANLVPGLLKAANKSLFVGGPQESWHQIGTGPPLMGSQSWQHCC